MPINLKHSGYAEGNNLQERIINVHRFTQVSIKQFEEESFDNYRKNISFLDNERYSKKRQISQPPQSARADPRYFTPSRYPFPNEDSVNENYRTILEEKYNDLLEQGKKSLNKSVDLTHIAAKNPIVKEPSPAPEIKKNVDGNENEQPADQCLSVCSGCYNREAITNKQQKMKDMKEEERLKEEEMNKKFIAEVYIYSKELNIDTSLG